MYLRTGGSVKQSTEAQAARGKLLGHLAKLGQLSGRSSRISIRNLLATPRRHQEERGEVFRFALVAAAPDSAGFARDPVAGMHQMVADAVCDKRARFILLGIARDRQGSCRPRPVALDIELPVRNWEVLPANF